MRIWDRLRSKKPPTFSYKNKLDENNLSFPAASKPFLAFSMGLDSLGVKWQHPEPRQKAIAILEMD